MDLYLTTHAQNITEILHFYVERPRAFRCRRAGVAARPRIFLWLAPGAWTMLRLERKNIQALAMQTLRTVGLGPRYTIAEEAIQPCAQRRGHGGNSPRPPRRVSPAKEIAAESRLLQHDSHSTCGGALDT